MIIAIYDCDKRIDAVHRFAQEHKGKITYIPGEVKHFLMDTGYGNVTYRLGFDTSTDEWTINRDDADKPERCCQCGDEMIFDYLYRWKCSRCDP
jgi:hypothetical protein